MKSFIILIIFLIPGVLKAQMNKTELIVAVHADPSLPKYDALAPIAEYLTKKLDIKIKPVAIHEISDLIEKLESGEIDIAFLNSFSYIVASSDHQETIEAIAVPGSSGNANLYRSCIFTASASGIKNLNQLKAKSSKLTMTFVNPTSASGHVVPRLYLSQIGFPQAESNFNKVLFGNDHKNTIKLVRENKNMVGATTYEIIEDLIKNGDLKASDINILWLSDYIVVGPVTVNKNMDTFLKDKIQQSLVNLSTTDKMLWQHIQNNWGEAKRATEYVIAKDSYYDSIRKMAQSVDDLVFIYNYYAD